MQHPRIALDGSVVREPAAGVQNAVREELRALLESADASPFTVFCRDAQVQALAARAGAAVGAVPALTARHPLCRILWQQWRLPARLRRIGAATLYAMAYTAPRRCPVPYVLHVHDLIALTHPELCARLNRWHMRWLLPGSIRRAAACVVATEHVGRQVVARLGVPPDRVHVVPLGVDAARFGTPAPRPAWLDARPYVLFVGNLEPKKGLDCLLRAYAATAAELDADLVLAGRAAWNSAALLRQARAYRGAGHVRLVGRVAAADLPGLYQHAWAAVMPSIEEGFGLPVLEAMAAGTPVVHSDHPALAETAAGAGIAVARGDAAQLGRGLLCLRQPQRRQDAVARGRAVAAARTWQRRAERVAEILRRVALDDTTPEH